MIITDEQQIDELLTRGVAEVIDRARLKQRLMSGKQLRVKLGIDPTSTQLHLGRSIPLLKLRDFQKLGHQIVFIVGNFTGLIGDTSDKDAERPMLDEETIKRNMETYAEQAGKIIDLAATEVRYNADWLAPLGFAEIGAMADAFSLHDFIMRENIKKRLDAGSRVSLREVLYPLMQGYDSLAVNADVELGGTDQRFNLLAGRTLQGVRGAEPQDILMTNLVAGTDGRKMSSSWGNTITLHESPRDMYGKVMSIPDDLVMVYFEHCTRVSLDDMSELRARMSDDPMGVKKTLAAEIVRMYHGDEASDNEADWFDSTFSDRKAPEDMPEIPVVGTFTAIDILKTFFGEEKSGSELRRLFEQGAVKRNEQRIERFDEEIESVEGDVWQVGKRVWFRIA